MSGAWCSIETAPKDGTKIDIWAKTWLPDKDEFVGRRFPDCYWYKPPWDSNKQPGWEGIPAGYRPTHWKPLPESPKEDLR